MYMIMTLLGIAILPPLILLITIWAVDKIEKETKSLISLLFGMGMFSCFPIATAESFLSIFNIFGGDTIIGNFIEMFFIVAICEEGGKFLLTFLLTWWNKNFNYKYDAIVYMVATSLGFATMENILYVMGAVFNNAEYGIEFGYLLGFSTGIFRMFLAIPLHFGCAVIMGYFYGYIKLCANNKKYKAMSGYLLLALLIPIVVHGAYDFNLYLENPLTALFSILLVCVLDITTIALIIISVKNDKMIERPILKNPMMYGYSTQFHNPYNQYFQMPPNTNNTTQGNHEINTINNNNVY